MAKVNETGHAINVANLEKLITLCISYGSNYNPSSKQITINSLKTLHQSTSQAMDNVIQANTAFKNVTNSRMAIFEPTKPLATRLINSLEATDASSKTIENAKAMNKKIQGTKTDKKKNDNPTPEDEITPDDKSISTSQQSYVSIREHFKNLVSILKSEPSYMPNETELQTTTLDALIDTMGNANTQSNQTYTDLGNSRIARNELMYATKTGLFDVSKEVKKYIKSVFGATHPHTKQANSIKFTNQTRK